MRTFAVIVSILGLFSLERVASSNPAVAGTKRLRVGCNDPSPKRQCTEPQPPHQDYSQSEELKSRVDALEEKFIQLRSLESEGFAVAAREAYRDAVTLVFDVNLEMEKYSAAHGFPKTLPDHLSTIWDRLFDNDKSFLLEAAKGQYPEPHQELFEDICKAICWAMQLGKHYEGYLFKEALEGLTASQTTGFLTLLHDLLLPCALRSSLVGLLVPVPSSQVFMSRLLDFVHHRLLKLEGEKLLELSKWVLDRIMCLMGTRVYGQDYLQALRDASLKMVCEQLLLVLPEELCGFRPFLRFNEGHLLVDGEALGREVSEGESGTAKLLQGYKNLKPNTLIRKVKEFRAGKPYEKYYRRRICAIRCFSHTVQLLRGVPALLLLDNSLTNSPYLSALEQEIGKGIERLGPEQGSLLLELTNWQKECQKDLEGLKDCTDRELQDLIPIDQY